MQFFTARMAFCNQCGRALAESEKVCQHCLDKEHPPRTITGEDSNWLFDDAAQAPSCGKATASMILGFFFFLLPCAFLAVVMGHMSLGEIRKSAGKLAGAGRAKPGLILGYLGIILLPVFLIGGAITIPALLRARIGANEASAVAFVRRLNTAEFERFRARPDQGYTCDFRDLEEFGIPEGRIPSMTLNVKKDGYIFMLEGCKGQAWSGAKPTTSYAIAAAPIAVNTSGVRLFCSDQSGVIKSDIVSQSVEKCLTDGTPLD
jgi:type IV pilus assembly protein PilA